MNWNHVIRCVHRWVSLVFAVAVIVNIIAWRGSEPAAWIGLLALIPLALLLITGLYLFFLPYVAQWRSGQQASQAGTMP